jgi:hypothetical protein
MCTIQRDVEARIAERGDGNASTWLGTLRYAGYNFAI